MIRKSTVTRKSTLHFEQIPLDEVMKRIAPDEATARPRNGTEDSAIHLGVGKSEPSVPSGHFHGVQFYNDPDALCRIVANFVGEGLEQGALAVIIATHEHVARVESCLRSRGIDADELRRQGNFATLDARDILRRFMTDGMPDASTFKRVVGSALADIRRGRGHCTIRAYGEMVDLLWKDGLEAAAIRLETLWNQLASTDDFELLCGYSMGNFYKQAAIQEIHDQHSAI
jgi:superfamily I DNA/RNA helicase